MNSKNKALSKKMGKKPEKYISYHSHKGGVNNLQRVDVGDKTFTSMKGHAEKRADSYLRKHYKD